MTDQEFESWLSDYAKRNSGVGRLLSESQSLVNDWYTSLGDYSLDELKESARYLATLDPQPYPAEHLPKLIAHCQSQRFKPLRHSVDWSREPSYKCLTCMDRGTVYCYDTLAFDRIRDGSFQVEKHLREVVYACRCEKGDQHNTPREPKRGKHTFRPLQRYNDQRHCMMQAVTVAEQVQELTEWVNKDKIFG